MSTRSRLTVYFEPPFWVGVYERESDGKYKAGKLVFGAEPKDFEVLELVQDHWKRIKLSPPVDIEQKPERAAQSQADAARDKHEPQPQRRRHKGARGAEAAIRAEQGRKKGRLKGTPRARKERRFEQRREKKKEKHRGH